VSDFEAFKKQHRKEQQALHREQQAEAYEAYLEKNPDRRVTSGISFGTEPARAGGHWTDYGLYLLTFVIGVMSVALLNVFYPTWSTFGALTLVIGTVVFVGSGWVAWTISNAVGYRARQALALASPVLLLMFIPVCATLMNNTSVDGQKATKAKKARSCAERYAARGEYVIGIMDLCQVTEEEAARAVREAKAETQPLATTNKEVRPPKADVDKPAGEVAAPKTTAKKPLTKAELVQAKKCAHRFAHEDATAETILTFCPNATEGMAAAAVNAAAKKAKKPARKRRTRRR